MNDSFLSFWARAVRNKTQPPRDILRKKEDLAMHKLFNSLKLIRGVLYRELDIDNEKKHLLLLPTCFIEQVLTGLQNDMGHPGKDRTLFLLGARFYWPSMTSDTDNWIKKLRRCIRRKSKLMCEHH